jgi:acyl carrier protein
MPRDVPREVMHVIADQLDVDAETLTREQTFMGELGADSRSIFELVLAFEEAFDIHIPDRDVEGIQGVGQAIDYVVAALSTAPDAAG